MTFSYHTDLRDLADRLARWLGNLPGHTANQIFDAIATNGVEPVVRQYGLDANNTQRAHDQLDLLEVER